MKNQSWEKESSFKTCDRYDKGKNKLASKTSYEVIIMADLYISSMGLISNMQKLNVHSNNLANISTNGYKSDKISFRTFDEAFRTINSKEDSRVIGNDFKNQVYADQIVTNFDPGKINVTNEDLDFTLLDQKEEGISFFAVEKDGEVYLTRNGDFTINSERNLVTHTDAYVLDANGERITIPENSAVNTDESGVMRNYNSTGETDEVLGRLQIHTVREGDLGFLQKREGQMYQPLTMEEFNSHFGNIDQVLNQYDTNKTLQSVFKDKETLERIKETGELVVLNEFIGRMESGVLETSNVDMASEMTELISTQRNIQSNQKTFTTMDKVLEKAANDIGRY